MPRSRTKGVESRTVSVPFRAKWIPLAQCLRGLVLRGYSPRSTSEFIRALIESNARVFVRHGDAEIRSVAEAQEELSKFKLNVGNRDEFDLLRDVGEREFNAELQDVRLRFGEPASNISEELKKKAREAIQLMQAKRQNVDVSEIIDRFKKDTGGLPPGFIGEAEDTQVGGTNADVLANMPSAPLVQEED